MSQFVPMRVRVEKNAVVRLKRVLTGNGKFNVAVGAQVSPSDIIGSATISSGFRIINLATLLSVAPSAVGKYLNRAIGQRIYRNELLAFKGGGLFSGKKVITAPTDGILNSLNIKTGELRMSFFPRKEELPAGVFGIVEQIDAERGLMIIRTEVSRVHGMFGSGKLRDGILHILDRRDTLVSKQMILAKHENHILVGGSLFFKDAISSAISSGANGIITGGINAIDYRSIAGNRLVFPSRLNNDVGISIVACEGFGSIAIGEDIFEILRAYEDKFVSIDGNTGVIDLPSFSSDSIIRVRSTKLPPVEDEDLISQTGQDLTRFCELKLGLKVRIIGNAFAGEQGKVIAIDKSETVMPSMVKDFLATIESSRRKIQIPVANCEVIL